MQNTGCIPMANEIFVDYLSNMLIDAASRQNSTVRALQHLATENQDLGPNYPIIVHCHLRWDGVWQRPQQFLSRLSQRHPVLFVEGPLLTDQIQMPRYRFYAAPGFPNITVLQSEFPSARFSDGAWVDEERRRLLKEALAGPLAGRFENPVQWFYDPMAVPSFLGQLGEIAVVYDCMDELSQFRFAPPEIRQRERTLLKAADVVFAGGRKLSLAKSRLNKNCHFYGCGVDVEHFARARREDSPIPADIRDIGKPILGYFGVVDERLDYTLITRLAEANRHWNIVMIGPAVKVEAAQLPRRENILWLGRREYADLPAYAKAFDVCLMPFALNEATEFINPTKALEYMATGRTIVSSAVSDVVSNFGDIVKVAGTHEEFVDLCCRAVAEPDRVAIDRGLDRAEQNRWESIVQSLERHIRDVLIAKGLAWQGCGSGTFSSCPS